MGGFPPRLHLEELYQPSEIYAAFRLSFFARPQRAVIAPKVPLTFILSPGGGEAG